MTEFTVLGSPLQVLNSTDLSPDDITALREDFGDDYTPESDSRDYVRDPRDGALIQISGEFLRPGALGRVLDDLYAWDMYREDGLGSGLVLNWTDENGDQMPVDVDAPSRYSTHVTLAEFG